MKNGILAVLAAAVTPLLWNIENHVSALISSHPSTSLNPTRRKILVSATSDDDVFGGHDGGNKDCGHGRVASRRTALSKFSKLTTAAVSSILAQPAFGAPVLTSEEADNLAARIERSRREKPPKLLRPILNKDFAVLLMRSSYNALDDIDCVGMDQFQKDFYFIRSSEYLSYVAALGPGMVQQGNLTDPYYFDFISFAQYATISREVMLDPLVVFEEQYGIDVGEDKPQKFATRVVRRDPSLSNKLLPERHDQIVGSAILGQFEEVFGSTASAIPKMGTLPDTDVVLVAMRQLVNLFLINGFAFGGKVNLVKQGNGERTLASASGAEFEIILNAPATVWSGKALQLRKAKPVNDFMLKCVRVLLSRSGYSIKSSSVKYSSTDEITTFNIR